MPEGRPIIELHCFWSKKDYELKNKHIFCMSLIFFGTDFILFVCLFNWTPPKGGSGCSLASKPGILPHVQGPGV